MARSPIHFLWAAVVAGVLGLACLVLILHLQASHELPLMLSAATVLGILSVCLAVGLILTAVSAQRREAAMQQALALSRDHFRLVADHATDLVYSLRRGAALQVDYVSPSAGELVGVPVARLMENPPLILESIVPEDLKKLQVDPESFWRSTELNLRTRRPDGTVVWWNVRQRPVLAPDGAVVGVEGIARDMTRMKRIEEALRERERQNLTLLGNLPGVAYRCGPTPARSFELVSAGCLDLFGRTTEELIPSGINSLCDLTHPDDLPLVTEEIDRALRTRTRFILTFRVLHKDGTFRWVWDRGIGVYDTNGEPRAIEGFLSDITNRKRADDERLRLLTEAQQAVAAREGFLSMATHDLRSPLTALKLYVQSSLRGMQKRSEVTVPDVVRMLDRIDRHIERMQRFVDGLLDAARASAGRLEMQLREVDLHNLAQEVTRRLAPQLRDAGCELRLLSQGHVVGRWDGLRLEQAVTNLLSNAIKYGAGKPIEVEVGDEDSWAMLIVRDQGIGLSPEGRERLFHRFERLSSEHRIGSTGLGLWIARLIVETHGGSISCASDGPGQGTTFTIRLPRAGPSARTPELLLPTGSSAQEHAAQ